MENSAEKILVTGMLKSPLTSVLKYNMLFYFRGPGELRGGLNPCTVKEERTGQEKPCIFPFQLEETMYYGCTTAGHRDDLEPWCSTKVNAINSVHVTGEKYFGNCTKSETCPLHKKALTKIDILESIFSPSKYLIGFFNPLVL